MATLTLKASRKEQCAVIVFFVFMLFITCELW